MSNFIRKCILEKEIFVVDMTPIMKIQQLLFNQANNINQIAKKINTNGVIYRNDIDYIKQLNENLSEEILKDEYEYVLSTHTDKKHIHNHIIFNNVNFVTGKCYQSNKKLTIKSDL